MKKIRIGSGAGYAGDRIEPAVELITKGNLDYIIFECLAERTIAIGQKEKKSNPNKGYNHLLEARFRQILPLLEKHPVKIITNMGSANPLAAVDKVVELAHQLHVTDLKIAYVLGDDISDKVEKYLDEDVLELGIKLHEMQDSIISMNVYLGAEGIIEALENDADIIITGRVSDPSLTIAPLIHEFGWTLDAHPQQFGQGVLAGHLLECGGQVTGGYYADPGLKDVEGLERLGFPLIEIDETGQFIVTKVEGSGGLVTPSTCKEQMIYEIHNPAKYYTPDAIADFSQVEFDQVAKDVVEAKHATSHGKPETLKVSIGYQDCFIGEGEISYGGSNALNRAKLAAEIVEKRLALIGCEMSEFRVDYIGYNSLYKSAISDQFAPDQYSEIRLHIAGRTDDRANATLIANEVEALYTNGPSGGAGASKSVSEIVSICSIFAPREDIKLEVGYQEV